MRRAKITVPLRPPGFVERPSVRAALQAQSAPPQRGQFVVLVSAPAGYGKTAAVTDWVRADPDVAAAWVGLDFGDRDERRWWASVLAALTACPAVVEDSPLHRVAPSWNDDSARAETVSDILDALDGLTVPVRLVLDDLQTIVDHDALTGLQELLRHPLPMLTIVLCSRSTRPWASTGCGSTTASGRCGSTSSRSPSRRRPSCSAVRGSLSTTTRPRPSSRGPRAGSLPCVSPACPCTALLGDAHPRERNVSFPDGGYHVQRSGWDPEARFLIFDCGPLGDGGHGHYDLLSFEAHAHGRPLVRRPRPRQLLRGAAEPAPLVPRHRRAQHGLRRRARPDALHAAAARSGRWRDAPLPRPRDAPGLDVLDGRGRAARAYEAVHRRRIAFVDDAPLDRRGPRSRASASTASTSASTCRRARSARPASRATPCSRPASRSRSAARRRSALEPGWVAPRYGELPRRAGRQRHRPRHEARTSSRGSCPSAHDRPARPRPRRAAARRPARRAPDGGAARRDRCERVNAKYRVGDSLRVVYRIEAGGAPRTSPGARSPGAAAASTAARPRRAPRPGGCPACCTCRSSRPCSGRSRTTAGWPACACSTAARARSTRSSATPSPAPA